MPKFCVNCGKQLKIENACFCPNCGSSINTPKLPKICTMGEPKKSFFKKNFNKSLEPDLLDAIDTDNYEKTCILLQEGANINYQGEKGITPLIKSLLCKDQRIFKLLIDSGSNINLSTNNGYSPLLFACMQNNIEMVKFFIDKGSNIRQKTKEGHNALELASDNPPFFFDENDKIFGNVPLQEMFEAMYKVVNYHTENDPSDIVNLLLKSCANPNDASLKGYTPLMAASKKVNHKTIQCLLKYNASVDSNDGDGNTALHYAVSATVEGYFKELINPNDNMGTETKFEDSFSLPMIATLKSKFENNREMCVAILIKNDANIHTKDDKEINILMKSAETGNVHVFKKLVDAGADIFYKNSIGLSPMFTAAMGGQNEVINYLISKGVDINIGLKDGETPLMSAVWYGHVDTVNLLIQKGANIKCKKNTPQNPTGEYPFEWAAIKYQQTNDARYLEIAELLHNAGATIPQKYR